AGLMLFGGAYLLARHYLARRWAAAAVAVLVATDVGLCHRNLVPLEHQLGLATRMVRGEAWWPWPGPGLPEIPTQFRIINPGVSLGFLWLSLLLLARARAVPGRSRTVQAGLGFGLLFYVYFYYWTTVGLTLALGSLLDVGRRRVYLHVAWIG